MSDEYDDPDAEPLGDFSKRRGLRLDQHPLSMQYTVPGWVVRSLAIDLGFTGQLERKPSLIAPLGLIVASVAFAMPNRSVHFSRDRNLYTRVNRYAPLGYTYLSVTRAVALLEECGLISESRTRPSPNAIYRSFFLPSERLTQCLGESASRHVISCVRELIVLRDESGKPVDYPETAKSRLKRKALNSINECLAGLKIEGVTSQGVSCAELGVRRRTLYRVFNQRFDQNGRLYGGFWQNLSKSERRDLRIDGQSVEELDYKGCHLRILAAITGNSLPFDDSEYDPFQLEGVDRQHAKLAFNILLNTSTIRRARLALAYKLGVIDPDFGAADHALKAVQAAFPFFSEFWCRGVGLRLQHIDSEICALNLQSAMKCDIPCLPVHDSFIVPERHSTAIAEIMEESFVAIVSRSRVMQLTI